MNFKAVSYDEWLEQREALLTKEKELTRMRDEISAQRRELPMVEVSKTYLLQTEKGSTSLGDLFEDTSQLIVYHFMYGEGWEATCSGCTDWANSFDKTTDGFSRSDARLIAVSNAPLEQLLAEKQRRGWLFDWVSAENSDFNQDFHGSAEETSQQVGSQTLHFDRGENHAITVFYKDEAGKIYLTYSCFNRGVEPMNGTLAYCDLLKKGRTW